MIFFSPKVAKDTFWFSHDFNARNDDRMLSLRDKYEMSGIGVYWCLIELMAESSERQISFLKLPVIARELWFDVEKLKEIVLFCCHKDNQLFKSNKTHFWSESLRKRLQLKDIKKEQAREAARASWDASAKRTHSGRNADAKLRERGEEAPTHPQKEEGEKLPALQISFEFLLGEVTRNCQAEKFSSFNPKDLAIKLSHVIKANGFEKANGQKVKDWPSQIYLLMEKELEFNKNGKL